MFNKISLKIGALLVAVIVAYLLLIIFVISPKITDYLRTIEENNAKIKLEKIASSIDSQAQMSKMLQEQTLLAYKKSIKDITSIAYIILEENYRLYKKNQITKEEAIKQSFDTIAKIKYGHELDYIYILDEKGNLVLHPDKRYANTNIYYTPDLNGKLFVHDIINNSMKNGDTYTRYSWHKLNQEVVSEKIVYSKYFKPFNMIVSSGVYIDDFIKDSQLREYTIRKSINDMLKGYVVGKSGYVYIVDQDFKLISHPNKSYIGKSVAEITLNQINEDLTPKIVHAYENQTQFEYLWNHPKDVNNFIHKKTGWVKYNDHYDWYIISSTYESDFIKDAKEINTIVIQVSSMIFFVLMIIGVYLIKQIVNPLNHLSRNAIKVKDGDFTVRNAVESRDEIGILAEQFNFMLDTIEQNINSLEHQVELRTNELTHKLYHDELTDIYNRYALLEHLKDKEFATLILIDIDTFDDINELYGFRVGNEVLKRTTHMLLDFSQKHDYKLYRLYGDIFGLLTVNMVYDFHKVESTIKGINELFHDHNIRMADTDIDVHVGVTMGISICQDEPIKTANIALKAAKKSDRNFYIYNNEIDPKEKIQQAIYWKNKIKQAILENKIVPFFQPILDREQNIVKYESLMRMQDFQDNKTVYITPNFFLDIAAKTKQHNELSKIMLERALSALQHTDKTISVNMGFENIQNKDFIASVDKLLRYADEKICSRLVFEILESDIIWDYSILEDFIAKYKAKGIKIAIDDFGAGYSNFKHILNARPDYLKIDGSLIRDIDKDQDSYELVKSIVQFSQSLGIRTIAEFVHSKEVFEIVHELGIDEFQGYYFGAPEKDFKD